MSTVKIVNIKFTVILNSAIIFIGDNMFFRRIAILFIHGFVGGVYDYDSFPNELETYRNYDVYTFTLPGHEKHVVKNVKHNDWIKAAEDQIEFLLNHNYKTIYVIGHSMGGVIAAHLASKYKEIKKLVLVAPAFRYFYFEDGKVNIKGINETLKKLPSLLKEEDKEKVIERIQKTPISTMLEFTKLVSEYQKDLQNITCPILTIHGLNDNVVPKSGTDLVYNTVKSKTNLLINIDKVTHDCFTKERKEEIKIIITNFLRRLPNNKKETINI